jgi:hypothetical protein
MIYKNLLVQEVNEMRNKIILPAMFAIAIFIAPAIAASAAVPAKDAPRAVLTVGIDEKTGDVALELTTANRPGGDKTVKRTIKGGVETWDKFDKWYEDLFGLTYLDDNLSRLWKQLRKRGVALADDFFDAEMLDALKGCELLVVVDVVRPFPADVFRIGDKWLFEIVPIVHSLSAGPKDLSDDYKYKSIVVIDCQGPKDREGLEAPGVDKNLGEIPGIDHKLITSLTRDETIKNFGENPADVLHLATHAHPDEFFPGRNKPGIKAEELAKMKLGYRTVLSTGCNTGNPVFAGGMLGAGARFFIASMYVTSGKDGIKFGDVFYRALFSGSTPFESFYKAKSNITGDKSTLPDILRFVFYVK